MKFVDSQEDMFLKMCKLYASGLDIPLIEPRSQEIYGPEMYTLIQGIPEMSDDALRERLLRLNVDQRLVLWMQLQSFRRTNVGKRVEIKDVRLWNEMKARGISDIFQRRCSECHVVWYIHKK